MRQKPPCPKCGSGNTYLEVPRFQPESAHISCYTCGWTLYGEPQIRAFVNEFLLKNREIEEEAARRREREREAARAARAERARIEEENRRAIAALRKNKEEEARKKRLAEDKAFRVRRREQLKREAAKKKAKAPKASPTFRFREGEIDPVLQLPWALPKLDPDKAHLDPCAWPPCREYSREKSKYCCRKCTVKVAHQRDRLRKAGKLSA